MSEGMAGMVHANDVRIASLQPQQIFDIEPRIHAGYDSDASGRLDRLFARMTGFVDRLAAGVLLVVFKIQIRC